MYPLQKKKKKEGKKEKKKRPWCWERLKEGREGDYRGWDGWMASQTQWTWVWVNSGSWWWTGRPGMLQSMQSQRVKQDWVTELNWSCVTHAFSVFSDVLTSRDFLIEERIPRGWQILPDRPWCFSLCFSHGTTCPFSRELWVTSSYFKRQLSSHLLGSTCLNKYKTYILKPKDNYASIKNTSGNFIKPSY